MKNEEMRLSVNFSLRELCKTKTGIENVPNEEQVNNLKRVCGWLEKLRKRWNERYADIGNGGMEEPLIINSGYRSPGLRHRQRTPPMPGASLGSHALRAHWDSVPPGHWACPVQTEWQRTVGTFAVHDLEACFIISSDFTYTTQVQR